MSKYQEDEQMDKAIANEVKEKIKKEKIRASKLRYRNSEKGHKEHRIWDWKYKNKIICDYEAVYDIVMNTHYCDNKECKKKLAYRGSKPAHNSKCLDHCHKCGCARGVLCNVCNLKNVFKCELCD